MKKTLLLCGAMAMLLSACTTPGAKTAIGAGAGAAIGAGAGAIISHTTGGKAGTGAIIGGAAGLLAGGALGNYFDAQAKELARIATVTKTENGLIVTLNNSILFETGKYNLSVEAQKTLQDLTKVLKKYNRNIIVVEGYTDSTGSAATNKALSTERAKAVYDYLLAQGAKTQGMSYVGYGATHFVADNNTEAGRASNRRVELNITAK
ncbi:MAG: OmpA family protein [Elusimicrobiota bacterium]|jgi:outer membrane protein OmpA-like peptidoglycan-associated protein|nr:OmpA family protein [Elusimicrobiota bacterium]